MKALALSISLGVLALAGPTLGEEAADARMREVVYLSLIHI